MSEAYSLPAMPAVHQARLDALLEDLRAKTRSFVGYPCNQLFDSSNLLDFMSLSINNVGDPFADSLYRLNTFEFEREVVQEVAQLLRGDPSQLWGYVTSGGTEGNMYGIYVGRELHPDGVVYYSEHTHYSASKIVRVIGCESIMIRGNHDGSVDLEDLRESLKINRSRPAIILANAGNTMHQAVDDILAIKRMLHDLRIERHYIHVDAAFSGFILPFIDNPPAFGFDAGIDSIAVSGHKLLGSPVPSGVVLARKSHVERVARSVEYVGCRDTTLAGSRNAFSPLMIWSALKRLGHDGLRTLVRECMTRADEAIAKFAAHGIHAWRHPHAITVVFPRPAKSVIDKWQIAPQGDIAHIITLPHLTSDILDELIADIVAARC